jgi:hypothetical protein
MKIRVTAALVGFAIVVFTGCTEKIQPTAPPPGTPPTVKRAVIPDSVQSIPTIHCTKSPSGKPRRLVPHHEDQGRPADQR